MSQSNEVFVILSTSCYPNFRYNFNPCSICENMTPLMIFSNSQARLGTTATYIRNVKLIKMISAQYSSNNGKN